MDTLLNVANSLITPLPAILSDLPLPPDVSVPQMLLLKNFPTCVDSLPADQRPSALVRFNRALLVETNLMLVTALPSDQYWTIRSMVIPDATFKLLCGSASTFLNFTLVDGANQGEFPILTLRERISAVAAAGYRSFFVRLDLRGKVTTMFSYERENE